MSRSNIFLIINLGCEMLYVIDQRLKAQNITLDKSAQVIRDITGVLLDGTFLKQLIHPHPDQHLLTPHQCRILLSDIAGCSLMRLDIKSMDKLWDLMIMVFKWQLSLINEPQTLMDITFRHMDGIARIIPEMRKTILIDNAKRLLIIEHWDHLNEYDRNVLVKCLLNWCQPFHIKLSVLIRLGFQMANGHFDHQYESELFRNYAENIGENIYKKSMANDLADNGAAGGTGADGGNNNNNNNNNQNMKVQKNKNNDYGMIKKSYELDSLVNQLNINQTIDDNQNVDGETITNINTNNNNDQQINDDELNTQEEQQSNENNIQKINVLLDDVSCNVIENQLNELANNNKLKLNDAANDENVETAVTSKFIQIETKSLSGLTTNSLTNALEQFRCDFLLNENDLNNKNEILQIESNDQLLFDATDELLKMLDEEN